MLRLASRFDVAMPDLASGAGGWTEIVELCVAIGRTVKLKTENRPTTPKTDA